MSHPHEYLLQEYKICIDKLVPLTPPEVVLEAKNIYDELHDNENSTEEQIKQALILVGRKEFPYRKAYVELCASDEEQRLQKLVFDRLEPLVKEKIYNITKHGVHVLDYIDSRLFEEQLLPDERYQVEQAVLLAHDSLDRQCDERAHERRKNYEELVAHWTTEEARLQALIDQLRGMADRDPKWKDEILGKAEQFEEGWSVVERDPTEEEITKEIEYWATVLEEGEEGTAEEPILA